MVTGLEDVITPLTLSGKVRSGVRFGFRKKAMYIGNATEHNALRLRLLAAMRNRQVGGTGMCEAQTVILYHI